MKKNIKPKKYNDLSRIIKLLETMSKNSKLMYDLLQQDIMHLENRLNVLESAGTYHHTTTYYNPNIKVEGTC